MDEDILPECLLDREDRENMCVIVCDAVGLEGTDASGGVGERPSESAGAVEGRVVFRRERRRLVCNDVLRSRWTKDGEVGDEGSGGGDVEGEPGPVVTRVSIMRCESRRGRLASSLTFSSACSSTSMLLRQKLLKYASAGSRDFML